MTDSDISTTLRGFKHKQRVAAAAFFAVVIIVLAATISILAHLKHQSQIVAARAEAQKLADEQKLKDAAAELHRRWDLRTDRSLNRSEILQGVNGDLQRTVIGLAIDLYEKRPSIPYAWGKKWPNQGFDSSGYVAYVLFKAHLPIDPATYYSGKLREDLTPVRFEDKQPGDVVLYDAGQCTFYLGGPDELVIGMAPGGIFTGNVQTYGQPRAVRSYQALIPGAPMVKQPPHDK